MTRAYHPPAPRRTSRLSIAGDAIEVLIRRLSQLSACSEVDILMDQAREQLAEVHAWKVSPPGNERRDAMMKRILELHFEVVRLERDGSKAP